MTVHPLFRLAIVFLAGCSSPSLPLWDAPMTDVDVAGLTFRVRHDGQRAEAVRVSPVRAPSKMQMLAHAKVAMEQASGCLVRAGTLYGDRVLAEALLDCPGQTPSRVQTPLIVTPR